MPKVICNEKIINKLSISGLSATFVGNGIGRFAYIALMPALIQTGWFTKSQASYLGAVTLLGYLVGTSICNLLSKYLASIYLLRTSMLICTLSYVACAYSEANISWYYFWRFSAGLGGAILMVLAAPAVLPYHQRDIRGRVSGIVFSGIGLGIVFSGSLIPFLAEKSVINSWLGMGLISFLLTIFSWGQWRKNTEIPHQHAGNSEDNTDLSKWQKKPFV